MFRSCRRILLIACALAAAPLLDAKDPDPAPLRTVAQIRALSPAELSRRPAAILRGTITYCEPAWYLTFLQDETGGIYLGTSLSTRLSAGDRVEVSGVAAEGQTSPIVAGRERAEPEVRIVGRGELPEAAEADPAHLFDTTYDAAWITVRGAVHSVSRLNDRASIQLDVGGEAFTALVSEPAQSRALPRYLLNAPVTVRGVLGRPGDRSGVNTETALYVPSLREFAIEPSHLDGLFLAPARTYSELFHASGQVRLRGLVTHVRPGRGFFMRVMEDGGPTGSLWVQTSQPLDPAPGQRVDVAASLQISRRKPWLADAVARIAEDGPEPEPQEQTPAQIASGDSHGVLVALEGVALEQKQGLREDSLILLSGNAAVCVRLEAAANAPRLPVYQKGSRIRVVGTAVLHSLPDLELEPLPFPFQIWARGAGDVTLLSRPPWWTMRRLMIILGCAVAVAAAGFAWAAALRRRVAAQTATIRDHLERQTLQEERMRVAREFHDTFEQHLVGLGLTLQTAQADAAVPPRVRGLLQEAAEMARHTRTEARHAIWELRTGGAASLDLASLLREELTASAHAAGVELSVEVQGAVRPLPAVVQNHLFRIAQESFTNALKHAGASRVAVVIAFLKDGLTLTVTDNGRGCDPAASAHAGSFGVAGMRERAVRMHGSFEFSSAPGQGAAVRVSIPLPSSHDNA